MTFINQITDNSKILIANVSGQYLDRELVFTNNDKQELECSIDTSCLHADIKFMSNSICNLLCSDHLSCLNVMVDINDCDDAQIVCNGDRACYGMQIFAHSDTQQSLSIECGESSSCNNIFINITGNYRADINCYGLTIFISCSVYRCKSYL